MTTVTVKNPNGAVYTILDAGTTGAGSEYQFLHSKPKQYTFQTVVTGVGAVSATVNIEVSNDGINWIVAGAANASGTTTGTGSFVPTTPHFSWEYIRANVSALTGTNVKVLLGC